MDGEPPSKKLKSQLSRVHSFVRFDNCTDRFVDLIWLNYEGDGVKYSTMGPRQFIDVNTYVGHPWIFRDSKSGDKLVALTKEIYEPQSWFINPRGANHLQRKVVPITIPVYSLTDRCLSEVRRLVKRCDIPSLEIPDTLITKLMSLSTQTYLRPP